VPKPSISGLQAAVGLTAGLISIVGAAYSAVQIFKSPPEHGEMVAIVREARTERPIADATIEVFTPQQALVTTLTPTSKGQIRHTLKEGPYRVRVSHPKFGAEVRQVVVQSGQTAEVRFQLVQRAGGSSPLGEAARAVNEGVGTVQRFFQGLGL
jgi:Carboxypeptidase regulatory-like domain